MPIVRRYPMPEVDALRHWPRKLDVPGVSGADQLTEQKKTRQEVYHTGLLTAIHLTAAMPQQMPAKLDLTDEEIRELREVFDLMDRDKGGTLSVDEVHQLLQLLGMTTRLEDVQLMVDEIDIDKSGEVDFDEFLQVAAKPQQLPYSKSDLLRSFRMFADRTAPAGCISPDTLEVALLKHCKHMLDPSEISRLVHTVETDTDGYIRFKDMVNLFMSK